jgi:hypothetical protein
MVKHKIASRASDYRVNIFILKRTTLAAVCLTSLFGQQASENPPQPGQLAQAGPTTQPETQLPDTMSGAPFTIGDKWDYRVVQSIGLRGLAGSVIGAAIGQARNAPSEWGQGVQGFSKRYVSGFAGNLSRQTFAFALESAFHEDPRYFPSEGSSKKARALNAAKQVFLCKTDAGGSEFAWARVISNFGGGQFDNLWQPKSTGSVTDGVIRSFIGLGADAAYNFMQEFIPFTRPHSLRQRHLSRQP